MIENIVNIVQFIITAGGLIVNTVLDFRKKEVSLIIAAIMGSYGILWRIFTVTEFSLDMVFGLLPGIISLFIAGITKESIGYGDGWILLALGISIGGRNMIIICMVALFAAGICAFILIVFFRKDRKYQIPFVPFILLGYLCMILLS